MANSAFSNAPTASYFGISDLTGDFNFESSQSNYYLRWTGIANITGTFRTDATHPISNSSVFTIFQAGDGTVSISGAAGVTVNGSYTTIGQHKTLQVIKYDSNSYDVIGGG